MGKILTIGGTKIYQFSAQDQKEMGHSFNYALQQGKKIKGFKNLSEINKILGVKYSPESFKRMRKLAKK